VRARLSEVPQMSHVRYLPLVAALLLVTAGTMLRAQETQPEVLPTRDVDISYQITRPNHPTIVERRRWLANEHLQRVDGPDKATTIFDRNRGEFILLNPANRTYRKFEGSPRQPMTPEKGTALTHRGDSVVAGLRCVDWSWTEDVETHTVCLTSDGVLLRLVVDGNKVIEARSVSYGQQRPELFEVPPGYEPALAPEGGPGP
jgi:hypothetical protein